MIILELIMSLREGRNFDFSPVFYFSPILGFISHLKQVPFLTSFSFLTCFRVEMDISYHFHKIRSKCEISLLLSHVKKTLLHA